MHTIKVSDDLVLEVHFGAHDGTDRALVKLRCVAMERDDAVSGSVVIWPEEMRHLVAALCTAAGLLAQDTARVTTACDPEAAGWD